MGVLNKPNFRMRHYTVSMNCISIVVIKSWTKKKYFRADVINSTFGWFVKQCQAPFLAEALTLKNAHYSRLT